MGIGDWGLGIGDWGLGPIPNPPSPIPNPPSPFCLCYLIIFIYFFIENLIFKNHFYLNKFIYPKYI